MLNFGDNAHHSHSDRCQPLTDREARATRCSLRVRAAEWPKGRHQLYGMQAQQSVLFRDLLAVEKIWGHCKLSSKIAEALVWFVRYTFFRKAWFVPLLLYWKQNCSRNTNFTKKTGEKTYERRIGLYDGRRGPLKNDGNYLPHGCRLHYLLKCHILSIMLSTMNCWRGWHGQFFCSGPRTGASGENVSTDHRPSKRSKMVRRFRRTTVFFFLNEPIAGTLKARLQKVSRKYPKGLTA